MKHLKFIGFIIVTFYSTLLFTFMVLSVGMVGLSTILPYEPQTTGWVYAIYAGFIIALIVTLYATVKHYKDD